LAAVLGHEIGHVLAKHANERMSQQTIVNLGLQAAGSFAHLPPVALQALGFGADVGVILPFSRAHEAEADLIGLKLMAKAGFNPEEAVHLWQAMATATKAAGPKPPAFLSTHPADEARIEKIRTFLPEVMPLYEERGALVARRTAGLSDCKSPNKPAFGSRVDRQFRQKSQDHGKALVVYLPVQDKDNSKYSCRRMPDDPLPSFVAWPVQKRFCNRLWVWRDGIRYPGRQVQGTELPDSVTLPIQTLM